MSAASSLSPEKKKSREENGNSDTEELVTLRRVHTERMYVNHVKSRSVINTGRVPKPVWVLSHHSTEDLARAVVRSCNRCQDSALKHGVADKDETRQVEYQPLLEWRSFADGFPNLFIRNVREMAGKDLIFIASFHTVQVIFEQLSMLYMLPRYLAHSVTVILPYFPTGTMERVDEEGQRGGPGKNLVVVLEVATAKTLATMLSDVPPTARGPVQILIYDIHALQERFYFGNQVVPRLETAVPLLIKELVRSGLAESGRLSIAFPDAGAEKRFASAFPSHWPRIVCGKIRDGDKRVVKLKEGEAQGRDVVIVDDLVQTGGTLREAAKVMLSGGASSVSAFVTHAVFPAESWRRFSHAEDKEKTLKHFWLTDSLPHAKDIAQHPPFHLLSLAPAIADALLGFDLRFVD